MIVPTALYRAEAWGMRNAESWTVNVLEMKCLRSLVEVSRMGGGKNEEVRLHLLILYILPSYVYYYCILIRQ